MLISYSHKFIFIHNYKVAGSSVKKALEGYSLNTPSKFHVINKLTESNKTTAWLNFKISNKLDFVPSYRFHASAEELKKQLPEKIWKNYFKFAFVRNPWDLHVSLYHYMLKNKNHSDHEKVKQYKTFENFVENRVKKVKEQPYGLHKQVNMICDNEGKVLVDYIGKMENLNEDFEKIIKIIGIHSIKCVPKINTSKHKHYKEYYTDHSKKLIADTFKEDIETFGYDFD